VVRSRGTGDEQHGKHDEQDQKDDAEHLNAPLTSELLAYRRARRVHVRIGPDRDQCAEPDQPAAEPEQVDDRR